jgi:hypothetical protein
MYGSTPTITVVLKDSSGAVVSTGNTTVDAGGAWASDFNVSQDYSNASLLATIDGTAYDYLVSGLTVSDPVIDPGA